MGLQSTFCECLVYILLGQVLRFLVLKEPEKKAYISLVTKVVMQITLPCLLLRNLSSIREISGEGWILIAAVVVHTILSTIVIYPLFHKKDLDVRAPMYCTCLSFNVGLFFYPIIEDIAGTKGVTTVAMEEIPADVVSFIVYVFIYDWGNKQRADRLSKAKVIELKSATPSPSPYDERKHTAGLKSVTPSQSPYDERTHTIEVVSVTPTPSPNGDRDHTIDIEEIEVNNKDFTVVPVDRPLNAVQSTINRDTEAKTSRFMVISRAAAKWNRFRDSKYYQVFHAGTSIFKSMPVMAILLGLILGVGFKVSLPTFLDNMLEKVSRSNTFMSMLLLGLLLNLQLKALKENILDALKVVLIRYVLGAVVALILYFCVGNSVSPTCKFIFAVGFFLPTPIVSGTYAFDKGYDPTLPVLIVNLTMIISFFLIWAITAILNPDLTESSSSSYSSSSSSSSMLSSISSSLFNNTTI